MLAVLLDISSKVLKAVTLAPKGTSRMHGCRSFSSLIFLTQFFIPNIIVKALQNKKGQSFVELHSFLNPFFFEF